MTPENYETWRDIMISYGETVIKILNVSWKFDKCDV